MEKIFKSLNAINNYSKKIITYGSFIVLAFCLIGVAIIGYNEVTNQQVILHTIGSSMVQVSSVMFAQIVIGALVIDLFNTMIHNH